MLANKIIMSPRELPAAERRRSGLAGGLRRLGDWLDRALHNYTTRRYLADMDDRMLADIGVSRTLAQQEASRWMWD